MAGRESVAREAARLIYNGVTKEYKHAKEMASRNIGISSMPSNHEVAVELDSLAEGLEGDDRRELLIAMRKAALRFMRDLENLKPVLTGSVWRGTARKGSDVDINVYTNTPSEIETKIKEAGYQITKSDDVIAVIRGLTSRSRHIIVMWEGFDIEVVVRPLEEIDNMERCEIYGDLKKGLTLRELEKFMSAEPLRKFVPSRRYR